jgi:hypothetical protein
MSQYYLGSKLREMEYETEKQEIQKECNWTNVIEIDHTQMDHEYL